jgi:hypothetical protein
MPSRNPAALAAGLSPIAGYLPIAFFLAKASEATNSVRSNSERLPHRRQLSSSPGGFHPEALTEPCLNLSIHTALHSPAFVSRERKPSLEVKAHPGCPVGPSSVELCHPLRSPPITGASTLLWADPPSPDASVFRISPLSLWLFPWHHLETSQVPYSCLNQIHDTSTPDTAWTISRLLPCLSREYLKPPVLVPSKVFSMLKRWFTFVRLSDPYLTAKTAF